MGGLRDFDITAAIWDAAYKDCRQDTLKRLASVLTARLNDPTVTADFLVARCNLCRRCREMPPPT